MLQAAEWASFRVKRYALQVTKPTGVQRSAYFLSIPYMYSIPLQLALSLLHWLVSQSFFLARVEVYEALPSDNIPPSTINAVGYSLYALIFVVALGGLMLFVLISFVAGRRLRSPIPLVGGCSLAIAAACHPTGEGHMIGDEIDTAEKELMWGVLVGKEEEMGSDGRDLQDSGIERNGTLHCALSAGEVTSPVEWINGDEKKNLYGARKTKVLFA
jgi:hypothetical protein